MEKANLLGYEFPEIHKGGHMDDCFKKRKEEILKDNKDILNSREGNISILDTEFNLSEFKRVLGNTGYSSPGCDNICYVMIRTLPFLKLFNKIWNEGKLPKIWKSVTIIPFPKPGKDASNPENE